MNRFDKPRQAIFATGTWLVLAVATTAAVADPAAGVPEPAEGGEPTTIEARVRIRALNSIQPFPWHRPSGFDVPACPGIEACPVENSIGDDSFTGRLLPDSVVPWTASNVSYNPLYFEDPHLERQGHTYCEAVQPFVSVTRFGAQLLGLPYQMALHPIHARRSPLGHYRPGECAPELHEQVPLNAEAAAVEGGVVTGLFFLIP